MVNSLRNIEIVSWNELIAQNLDFLYKSNKREIKRSIKDEA